MAALASARRATTHASITGGVKRFGTTTALDDVDLSITSGEVHALVGENGAGKSTVGKVLAGLVELDTGTLRIDGNEQRFRSPRQALRSAVGIVTQEIALVPHRTVVENVFLGIEPARGGFYGTRHALSRFGELLDSTGFVIDPHITVSRLRVAQQQQVEILRALAKGVRLLVLDEPTAALTPDDAHRLFRLVRALREQGTTVVYISHFLAEVLALADRVTVMKDGRVVRTQPSTAETPDTLVEAMLGKSLDAAFPPKIPVPARAPVQLSARGLLSPTKGRHTGIRLENVSLEVRAGEILGITGLIGSGRTELARAIVGADSLEAGEIAVAGKAAVVRHPRDALRAGMAMVPESRKDQGLLLERSTRENIGLATLGAQSRLGFVDQRGERCQTDGLLRRVGAASVHPERPAGQLSGGNQQKVLIARAILGAHKVLVADEPTRGVDIGAKQAIYDVLRNLAAEGIAIVMISSEIEEVVHLAHRVLVMRAGRVVRELNGKTISEDEIMRAAFGRLNHEHEALVGVSDDA